MLSQDHLETLFSKIRQKGGFNDNPNCVRFKAAFIRILVQNEIRASFNANCDDRIGAQKFLFGKYQFQKLSEHDKTTACKEDDEYDDEEDDDEEDFQLPVSDDVNDIVIYIAGYVERSV